ncbi:epididymal-specific lipocalin-5-like isoform X1 [Grammomys surdaster]|nr:epididymal-specific lipocalin-5-like isoform X1 [Grammomys surdaster]
MDRCIHEWTPRGKICVPWRWSPKAPLSSRWMIHLAGLQCASNPPNENLLCLFKAPTGKDIKSRDSEPKAVASGWGAEPMCSVARHMESIMLFTLLGLCVGLAVGTEGAVVKDFDISKFLGFWYEIALASKMDAQGSAHKEEKMGAMIVELKENLLSLTTTYYNEDHCVLEKVTATQMDGPAKFKVTRISGKKEVAVVATDYMTYAVIDVTSLVSGTVHRVIKLYSRSLEDNEEALNNFQKIALKHGFLETDIYILKHD